MYNYNQITQSIQKYLKAIYSLGGNESPVSTNALAASLKVSAPSVSGMLKRLSADTPPLVIYQKHQGVLLTAEGLNAALEVIRHHRLLETYLVTKLGYAWDEVHEEAERLQHAISEDLEAHIDAALGYPTRDPHGEPIPRPDLSMPIDNSLPLSALRPPQSGTISRVHDTNSDLLVHLKNSGLMPGRTVKVEAYSPYDENLTLLVEDQGKNMVIGPAISSHIFVDFIRG
jgi:DtxR family transcriptional regulator, Mn-dependent transcriptional regulator